MNPISVIKLTGKSLICLMFLSGLTHAETQLNQAKDRITDQAINADLATYEQTQSRIAAINANGFRVADYSLSKAQCWLDVSLHEYTRNDRSAFPQEAIAQADNILTSLEAKTEVNPETPLINNADRLREDLWARIGHLKNAKGFSCYAQQLACAEVELVHAGNEHKQQGWRHAKPYIQIAEDLIAEADTTGEGCLSKPVVTVVTKSIESPKPSLERLEISADALFKFNKADIDGLMNKGKAELDMLVTRLQNTYVQIEKITLIGHTDRLGNEQYNKRLSMQRALTIKKYLTGKGITSSIHTEGHGEENQLAQCGTTEKANKALIDCLQPNRRVTVEIVGIKKSD